jgi:hypothetical protein
VNLKGRLARAEEQARPLENRATYEEALSEALDTVCATLGNVMVEEEVTRFGELLREVRLHNEYQYDNLCRWWWECEVMTGRSRVPTDLSRESFLPVLTLLLSGADGPSVETGYAMAACARCGLSRPYARVGRYPCPCVYCREKRPLVLTGPEPLAACPHCGETRLNSSDKAAWRALPGGVLPQWRDYRGY